MYSLSINDEKCKACGLCVYACPKKIVELSTEKINSKGYHPAIVTDQSACTGCALCAVMCPDVAIKIEKGEN